MNDNSRRVEGLDHRHRAPGQLLPSQVGLVHQDHVGVDDLVLEEAAVHPRLVQLEELRGIDDPDDRRLPDAGALERLQHARGRCHAARLDQQVLGLELLRIRWMVVMRSNLRVQQTQPLGSSTDSMPPAEKISPSMPAAEVVDQHHGLLGRLFSKFPMKVVLPEPSKPHTTVVFISLPFSSNPDSISSNTGD